MNIPIPTADGDLNRYDLTGNLQNTPRIHYVNGMQTDGPAHAKTAALLSILTENTVWGIFNKTNGFLVDLGQCLLDYTQNAGARASRWSLTPNRNVKPENVSGLADRIIKKSIVWNKATATLFESVMDNMGKRQLIIAHSQGNLVTSNALFVVERALGSQALQNVRVYSLASPSPGWPLGLRVTNGGGGRQENAFMNDIVALLRPHNLAAKVGVERFQNAGDFRTHGEGGSLGLNFVPHEIENNMELNFLKSIRKDLGLSPDPSPNFLSNSSHKVDLLMQSK